METIFQLGSGTWTQQREDENRQQAFDMWVRERKVRLTDRKIDEEVLGMVGQERKLPGEIMKEQSSWLEILEEGMLEAVICRGDNVG
jgi:hypothetical protein